MTQTNKSFKIDMTFPFWGNKGAVKKEAHGLDVDFIITETSQGRGLKVREASLPIPLTGRINLGSKRKIQHLPLPHYQH